MFFPPLPVGWVFPSGNKVMRGILCLVECPQERGNVLLPDGKLPDFMLHILHTVGVKHSHIDHAGLEELCHALCQQDTRRIEVDGVEVTQLWLAQTGVDVPVPVAEFLDKIAL